MVVNAKEQVFTSQDQGTTINGQPTTENLVTSSSLAHSTATRTPPGLAPRTSPNVSKASNAASTSFCLSVNSIGDLKELAGVFAASGMFNKSGSSTETLAKCCVQLMAGLEAGFSPFASITGIYVISGKPGFSAQLLAQAIKRSNKYDYRVLQKNIDGCKIEFLSDQTRESLGIEEFTQDMAKRAGLWSNRGPWGQYPEAMLFARCLTAGMRTHCPDALNGHTAYTPEEIGGGQYGDIDENGMVEVTEIATPPGAMPRVEPTAPEVIEAQVDVSESIPDAPPVEEPKPKKTRRTIGKKTQAESAPEQVQQVEESTTESKVVDSVADIASKFNGVVVTEEVKEPTPEESAPAAPEPTEADLVGEERYKQLTGMHVSAPGIAALLQHSKVAMEGGVSCLARIDSERYAKMIAYFGSDAATEGGMTKEAKVKALNTGIIGKDSYPVSSDSTDQYLDALGKLFN